MALLLDEPEEANLNNKIPTPITIAQKITVLSNQVKTFMAITIAITQKIRVTTKPCVFFMFLMFDVLKFL